MKSTAFGTFSFALIVSLVALLATLFGLGAAAFGVVVILMIIELTFSFDNAIINARVLERMSAAWQRIFMSAGIIIAVFGMRVLFPIVLVMVTAHRGFGEVVNLALYHQGQYAVLLEGTRLSIESFGGSFLMMLALGFLFDNDRDTHWVRRLEKSLQRYGDWWTPATIVVVILVATEWILGGSRGLTVALYGVAGIVTYLVVHGISKFAGHAKQSQVTQVKAHGLAGFVLFLYLEVLDASFSLDGVVGAFAISENIILIAIGLGLGAIWIRSLTLFMVRRGTLKAYRYLDHGAHYTILMLAIVMFIELFFTVPEWLPGVLGVLIIGTSVVSSARAARVHAAIS
ncbi:MAG TPA: DUF475 domain-containing protein [Candidatus Saccharimonadaceae bacterium]|nr:DUF475 domain-containing protein [Candidatus Saccharimonadaceae bacterium]